MTAHGTRETAMEAITRGAYDFFTKPLKMDEFQVVVARALDRRRLQKQVKALRDEPAERRSRGSSGRARRSSAWWRWPIARLPPT